MNWWLLKSGTERNGMERFRLLKYGTHGTEQSRNSHGTVSFASLNGIDHGLLPVNDERIFRFANGWDVLCTLLEWKVWLARLMLREVVTGTSSGSPCMDATSLLYTTLAIRKAKYPLVIDREQAMIKLCHWSLYNWTVPFRAFRILVGGTVPFRSVPFWILVTTVPGTSCTSIALKVVEEHVTPVPY